MDHYNYLTLENCVSIQSDLSMSLVYMKLRSFRFLSGDMRLLLFNFVFI